MHVSDLITGKEDTRRNHITMIKGNLAENGRGRRGCGPGRSRREEKKLQQKVKCEQVVAIKYKLAFFCGEGEEKRSGLGEQAILTCNGRL